MDAKIKRVIAETGGEWGIYSRYLDTGEEIFSLDADKKFYAASANKVPIAVAALKQVEGGSIRLDDRLKLADGYRIDGSGVLNLFQDGLEITVRDVISVMLAQSDNTAAKMLVDQFSVQTINDSLSALGLKTTQLEDRDSGKFYYGDTTPSESAQLLKGLYDSSFLSQANSEFVLEVMKECHMNWGIGRFLPHTVLDRIEVSNKEGTWEDSRHETAIVWAKQPYSLSIYSKGLVDKRIHVDNVGVLAIAEISKIIYESTNG